MSISFFVSDLHGSEARYRALFAAIERETPEAVFFGGDLFASGIHHRVKGGEGNRPFLESVLLFGCRRLQASMGSAYPRMYLLLGNDDGRFEEEGMLEGEVEGVWYYMHNKVRTEAGRAIGGYACIPPSPFRLKHFERYDVSAFVDPGSMPPEDGWHGLDISPAEIRRLTIEKELRELSGSDDLSRSIWLFHAPPYETALDRAALDDLRVDHVPLDVHIGSIAIRRFIEQRQPLLTLHGHVHESARLTGRWRDTIGRTHIFSAAHDGPELALVRFDVADLAAATRELIPVSGSGFPQP
jgi:Icc-related predicted phosphoesterase